VLCDVRGLEVRKNPRALLRVEDLRLEALGPYLLSGPNGAGKTTLLSVLAALERPSAGTVEVLGERIWPAPETRRREFRRRAVLCETEPVFFRGDVLYNVNWGLGGGRRVSALEEVGAVALARRDPANLSTGERRRVDLARALARSPRLLLLDEPSAHLDDESASWLARTLERLAGEGVGVLFSCHADRRLAAIAREEIALARIIHHGADAST
jgi:tungstate transport system ATP-binding protein